VPSRGITIQELKIYPLLDVDDVLKAAKENEKEGVHRFSLVTSGKSVSDEEFERFLEYIRY